MYFSKDFDKNKLRYQVRNTVEKLNLHTNKNETKLITSNNRQTVTGKVVSKKPQVVFHERNDLR
jgi:hypothetical protein